MAKTRTLIIEGFDNFSIPTPPEGYTGENMGVILNPSSAVIDAIERNPTLKQVLMEAAGAGALRTRILGLPPRDLTAATIARNFLGVRVKNAQIGTGKDIAVLCLSKGPLEGHSVENQFRNKLILPGGDTAIINDLEELEAKTTPREGPARIVAALEAQFPSLVRLSSDAGTFYPNAVGKFNDDKLGSRALSVNLAMLSEPRQSRIYFKMFPNYCAAKGFTSAEQIPCPSTADNLVFVEAVLRVWKPFT